MINGIFFSYSLSLHLIRLFASLHSYSLSLHHLRPQQEDKQQSTLDRDIYQQKEYECKWQDQNSCPLSNKCLTASVVYQATVTRSDKNEKQTYVGHTEGEFKTRFNNHTSLFKKPKV